MLGQSAVQVCRQCHHEWFRGSQNVFPSLFFNLADSLLLYPCDSIEQPHVHRTLCWWQWGALFQQLYILVIAFHHCHLEVGCHKVLNVCWKCIDKKASLVVSPSRFRLACTDHVNWLNRMCLLWHPKELAFKHDRFKLTMSLDQIHPFEFLHHGSADTLHVPMECVPK